MMDSIINMQLLVLFVPTFFLVSATPGMCMTLSLTLGMTIGVKRTLWMMAGELVGVAIVAVSAVIGVATVMLTFPALFWVLKIIGLAYLSYLGWQLWHSSGKMAIDLTAPSNPAALQLATQGFITAIANPKGWAFCIALFPPFIDQSKPLVQQLTILIGLFLTIEFICLLTYASGGSSLRRLLLKPENVTKLNRAAGVMMAGVGLWLLLS